MLSEWEVSFLGFTKKVLSELEEAESPSRLRWSYGGPVEGCGGGLSGGGGGGGLACGACPAAAAGVGRPAGRGRRRVLHRARRGGHPGLVPDRARAGGPVAGVPGA